jgi:hypothetical protein
MWIYSRGSRCPFGKICQKNGTLTKISLVTFLTIISNCRTFGVLTSEMYPSAVHAIWMLTTISRSVFMWVLNLGIKTTAKRLTGIKVTLEECYSSLFTSFEVDVCMSVVLVRALRDVYPRCLAKPNWTQCILLFHYSIIFDMDIFSVYR